VIYNIAARVFYANNQLQNAVYAFQKAQHLTEEDLLYMGLSYLKLFQRYLEERYLRKAIRTFSKIKKVNERVRKILEKLSFDEELKNFIQQHIQTLPYSKDKEPIVHDIYTFLKERGKFYSHSAIENYWRNALRMPIKDPMMLTQMVIYSLHKRKPLQEITPELIVSQHYFPLLHNPKREPLALRKELERIFELDYEIFTLNMLSPHLGQKIKKKKEELLQLIQKLYKPLFIYFSEDDVEVFYSNLIKSLRSLTPQEKWKLLDKY